MNLKIRLYFKSFKEIGFGPIFCLSLEKVVDPVVTGMGYELVDVQASGSGRLLRLFIDKPGGISLGDCEAVSRQLTRVLAVEGIDYDRMEVSSPGLDRPLRKAGDFARFAGQKADLRMRVADATGRRRFVGVLRGIDGESIRIEVDGQAVALDLANLDRAKLVPEF